MLFQGRDKVSAVMYNANIPHTYLAASSWAAPT